MDGLICNDPLSAACLAVLLVTSVQTLLLILAGKVSDATLVLWSQTLD